MNKIIWKGMKTIVCFLSRAHGFEVLKKILKIENCKILEIYTHKLKPKSEDPSRSEREDYKLFEKACSENDIPIFAVDSKDEIIEIPECDFIVEVSWRYLINSEITDKARISSFGIHRGKLPEYSGAQPIKQALEKNEKMIYVTAHILDPEIDAGDSILVESHPVNYDNNFTKEDNIQRLRNEITPLFGILAEKTLIKLEEDYSTKINFSTVTNEDYDFLYELLKKRDPIVNISHKMMPTVDEHKKFVNSNPYTKWCIIHFENKKIGAAYLSKQDEIGVSFLPKYDIEINKKIVFRKFMELVPRRKYFANVNPKNIRYKNFLQNNNFVISSISSKDENRVQDIYENVNSDNWVKIHTHFL